LHHRKRRRFSTAGDAEDSISIATKPEELDRTITTTASTSAAVSEQESLSIWNKAARTKRISILLLRDLEMTHSPLLREIAVASIAASSTLIPDGITDDSVESPPFWLKNPSNDPNTLLLLYSDGSNPYDDGTNCPKGEDVVGRVSKGKREIVLPPGCCTSSWGFVGILGNHKW
jgi:hypothetical protein